MIVPMKKVSLIIPGETKEETLRILRKLGIVHIEITEGTGEKIAELQEQLILLEQALYILGKLKNADPKEADEKEALAAAAELLSLEAEKKQCQAEKNALQAELDRLQEWGDVDPAGINDLASRGMDLAFYEMPKAEYEALGDSVKTVRLDTGRASVKFLLLSSDAEDAKEVVSALRGYRLELPQMSTAGMRQRLSALQDRMDAIDAHIGSCGCYAESFRKTIQAIGKAIEFETYATGMAEENLAGENCRPVSVACFQGYVEAENLDRLRETAAEHSWGLMAEDPCEEDNVPTKLKNNAFVRLVYPLTDFMGTVPGYFEYDISGWFLAFILIFFGIIFGDGGYGLVILAAAAVPILHGWFTGKPVAPAFLLAGLFGLSTILWGTLTCTWFGLAPEYIPLWLQRLSVPVISNVYADRLWHPFWTSGTVGLTTAQNLQIVCFSLALVQLTIAHIKESLRNRASLKVLGDIGSILQLFGIFYLVLSLVVNAEVFHFGLVIGGIPVGTVAVILIGVGFLMNFVFANYEGSIPKAILSSLTNIVSVLLGVVNVFSDIVSYIRLWAVGLAGAAISATVNELAGPLLGNFMFMILAIVLLIFGHGLNMVLNVLSVIVHGIRLNTLEFSSHLNMSWTGHKFKPFKE